MQVALYGRINSVFYKATNKNDSIELMENHPFYYNRFAKLQLDTYVDYFAKNYSKYYSKVENITLIAITGGSSDLVVDPPTEIIDGILPPKHGFSVMASYIPGVNQSLSII